MGLRDGARRILAQALGRRDVAENEKEDLLRAVDHCQGEGLHPVRLVPDEIPEVRPDETEAVRRDAIAAVHLGATEEVHPVQLGATELSEPRVNRS